ncbi:uncharacterized protein METZ01_LOCUS183440 [marine metagenome]|uniref:Uncharacterized protein n=1 Tax=marine metagenome TaxID=408172 RepID=A0A382CWL0_9ZZZZ
MIKLQDGTVIITNDKKGKKKSKKKKAKVTNDEIGWDYKKIGRSFQ